MYSLAGFIQLLLILSQSDYLPDLSWVWIREASPVATVSAKTSSPIWLVPVTATDDSEGHAVAGTHRNKWMLSPALQKNGWLLIPPSNKLPAGRVINSDKLYLMFCRLKIGG
jgi:hypothetical protein